MKIRGKNNRELGCLIIISLIVMTIIFSLVRCDEDKCNLTQSSWSYKTSDVNPIIEDFAQRHGLPTNSWPDDLVALLEKNPETKDFVLHYPLKKGKDFEIDLSEYKNSERIPLLMQWDERWGYNQYAGDLMGLSGCGPTCLSMVCMYLLNDTQYSPKYVAEFAEQNGYSIKNNGSAWALISEGGEKLGLDVTEIPLDENRIIRNLMVGNPIICIMGPGEFTTTGHFIVMTEYVEGKVKINDPNSKSRSEKLWSLSDIKYQIRNLWVCR